MAQYWYLTDMGHIDDNEVDKINQLKKSYGTLYIVENNGLISLKYVGLNSDGSPKEITIFSQN